MGRIAMIFGKQVAYRIDQNLFARDSSWYAKIFHTSKQRLHRHKQRVSNRKKLRARKRSLAV